MRKHLTSFALHPGITPLSNMEKRHRLVSLGLLIAVVVACAGLACPAAAAERPNIIVIFMDDMGYNDVGALTYPAANPYPGSGPVPNPGAGNTDPDIPAPNRARFLTPHLDSLAAEGLTMPQFYATPLCSLSRASLMTGRYCRRVSVNQVFFPDGSGVRVKGLNTTEVTLPELLRQEGYATGMVGKWHLGYVPTAHDPFQMMPTRHGFEEFFGHPHSNDMDSFDLIRNETVLEADFGAPTEQSQITWRSTEAALDFIERKSAGNRPFFLYFPQIMTHVQCWPSDREFTNADGTTWPKFMGTSGVSYYYDVVKEVDHSVGRILTKLAELGIEEKTLVVFTSDNGPWTNLANYNKGPGAPNLTEYSVGSAYPLKDGKFATWEGGVRVPFLARWKGRIAPGTVLGDQVGALTDFLPTFVRLAGGTLPTGRTIDGVDLGPVWKGEAPSFSRTHAHFPGGGTLDAIVRDQWKLKGGKLYDVRDLDDQETTDHAASQPAIVANLQAEQTAILNSLAAETAPLGEFTPYEVELSGDSLTVNEGGTASFQARLSANPGGNVTVSTARFSGDAGLSVSAGGSLSFNSANWSAWQTVTLAAAQDADALAGGATFRVSVSGHAVVREVFAFEDDDEAADPVAVSRTWPKSAVAAIADTAVKLVAEVSASVGGTADPAGTSYVWHKVSGPGTVTFSAPAARETTVAFSHTGVYRLRLTADHPNAGGPGVDEFDVYVGVAAPTSGGPEATATLAYDATADTNGNAVWENLASPGIRDWALTPGITRSVADPAPALSFIDAAWQFAGGVTGQGATSPDLDAYSTGDASIEIWFKPASLPVSSPQVLWETGGDIGASFTLDGGTLKFAVDDGAAGAASGAVAVATLSPLPAQDGFVHAVGVIDLAGDKIRLHIDGALADTRGISTVADWCGASPSGLGKVDATPLATGGGSAAVDFDPSGELASQFSGGPYSEAPAGGLSSSTGVVLANGNVTSFVGSQSASLAAGKFSIGESFSVGAYFKLGSFGTATGVNGQILRLGITNGGTDTFTDLPFSTIEMVNPATGLAKFVIRDTNASLPSLASFTLATGQWYFFETTFTRSGTAAVDYDFSIAPASPDGTVASVLASARSSNVGSGLVNTELDKAIYGGFKGHGAYANGASGVLDRFSVVAGGKLGLDSLGGNDLLSASIGGFAGQVAVMRIYDRALGGAEVGELADGPESANIGPKVSAGDDQAGDTLTGVSLLASLTDDGLPAGSPLTTLWKQTSGPDAGTDFPATAAFGNPSSLQTGVNFAAAGEYMLQLEADDSEIKVSDSMLVSISPLSYAQWASGNLFPPGQATSGSNPDHDRFINLWEWVLGYNPLQPDPLKPGVSFSSSTVGDSRRLTLEMDVPRDRHPDVTLEESGDLKIWNQILDSEATVVPVSASHARWTLSHDIPSTEPRRFLRVAATE